MGSKQMKCSKLHSSFLAAALLWSAPASAFEDASYVAIPDTAQIESDTVQAAADALRATESLATSVSFAFDYLTAFVSEANPPDFLTHAELKATTARLEGVRSILIVARDGELLHDAYSFPAPSINLSERQYVQDALANPGLILGKAILGQTSGIPFVPISTFKPALGAVLTAIVDTRTMREPLNWCDALCAGAVLTLEGEVVASSPPESTIPDEIISRVTSSNETSGTFVYERENFKVLIAFRKSERFPITVLASHSLTPSGALATQ